jgi:hypothetical protein
MFVQLSEVEGTGAIKLGAMRKSFYVRLFLINARAIAAVTGFRGGN